MQIDGFHHVAVQVKDVARVAAFYVDVLGLPELKRFHRDDQTLRSVWVGVAPGFLAIEQAPELTPDGVLGFSMLALRIPAAKRAETLGHLERHGVAIEKQSGWTIYFRDPEGNFVGLSHHPDDTGGSHAPTG